MYAARRRIGTINHFAKRSIIAYHAHASFTPPWHRRSKGSLPAHFAWPDSEEAARHIRIGVYKFNRNPRRGIDYLVSKGLVENHPRSIGVQRTAAPRYSSAVGQPPRCSLH
jgi:hypothetical protein